MVHHTTYDAACRQLHSKLVIERMSAVDELQRAGLEGWRILAEFAADPELDADARVSAACGLPAEVPVEIAEPAARALLTAEDPVLRARGLVLVGRGCLTGLRGQLMSALGDAGRFWELDTQVSLAKLTESALGVLNTQRPDPEFPDWQRVTVVPAGDGELATPYLGLRQARLQIEPSSLGVTPENFPYPVVGVLIDMGLPEGVYSWACWADGSTTAYLSDGNATEGFGDFPRVRAAARRLLARAQGDYARARSVTEFPAAEHDRVRFYLRGFSEVRSFDLDEASLMTDDHPLGALYDEAHAVLSEVHAVERDDTELPS